MKKIAVNTVKAFLKENKKKDTYTQVCTVGDSSFEVVIHTALTVVEKSTFLNRVVSGCFDATGKYRPEYFKPMLRATILQMCTNVPALTLKNETDEAGNPVLDIDAMNELYLALGLNGVEDTGYVSTMSEMSYLCRQVIEWKQRCILANRRTDAALRELLETLAEKVKDVDTDALTEYAKALSENTKGLDENGIVQTLLAGYEKA